MGFEAASSARHMDALFETTPINELLSFVNERIISNARSLVKNNAIANKAKTIFANYCAPIRPYVLDFQKSPRHELIQHKMTEFFTTTKCDVERNLNLYAMQQLEMSTVHQDGSVMCQEVYVRDWKEKGLPVPIQFRSLKIDELDTSRYDRRTNSAMGIEHDVYGTPKKYWLKREQGSVAVDAQEIMHMFEVLEPGQRIGVSKFAPVLVRLRDTDEYVDAAVVLAKIASMFVGYWEDQPGGMSPNTTEDSVREQIKEVMGSMTSGTILPSVNGKKLVFNSPPQFGDFSENHQEFVRTIATGYQVPAVLLTNDFSKANRASMRINFGDFQLDVNKYINMWISQSGEWKIERFLKSLESIGISTEGIQIGWTQPPRIQVEPDKETLANSVEIAMGVKSPFEWIREKGKEPRHVLNEIKKSQEAFEKLGFKPEMVGQILSIYNKESNDGNTSGHKE